MTEQAKNDNQDWAIPPQKMLEITLCQVKNTIGPLPMTSDFQHIDAETREKIAEILEVGND